ncbi:MAG: hypothetical protein D6768_07570 [Chloroflexi bacterium]|nr:MAG: hypothetical protein D6768_07570 [Chloroflexota bacterium]
MTSQKALDDWLIATRETIYQLQRWLRLLENWRLQGHIEPHEFAAARRELAEAGLGHWAEQAGGHGLEALARLLDDPKKCPLHLDRETAGRPGDNTVPGRS